MSEINAHGCLNIKRKRVVKIKVLSSPEAITEGVANNYKPNHGILSCLQVM